MPVYGSDVSLSVCFQTSFDTIGDFTASGHHIPAVSETFNADQPLMMSEGIRGRVDRGDAYAGAKQVTGEIETEAASKITGFLLASCLERTSLINSGSLRTHEFTPRTSDAMENCPQRPMSLAKTWGDGANDVVNYYNLTATGFEINCDTGEALKIKIPYIGGRNDNGNAAGAGTYVVDEPFLWDQCSLSINGAGIGYAKSVAITLDESLEAKHTLAAGDQWPDRIVRNGFRSGTISVGLSFDGSSEYAAFSQVTASGRISAEAVNLHFKHPLECQSGYNHSLNIYMPYVSWDSLEAPTDGHGEIEATLSGRLTGYTITNSSMVVITLVNTHTHY